MIGTKLLALLPLFNIASTVAVGAMIVMSLSSANEELSGIRAAEKQRAKDARELAAAVQELQSLKDSLSTVSHQLRDAKQTINTQTEVIKKQNDAIDKELSAINSALPARPKL